jgi:hypothetical protein
LAQRKRNISRRPDITDEHEAWLRGDDKAAGVIKYFLTENELAALWAAHSERIVEDHVADFPGTRPARWWQYSAPRIPLGTFPGYYYDGQLPAPRKRLGGTGTPAADVLAYVPTFSYGLPTIWIEPWMVRYYSGLAVDIRGEHIGGELREFKGVAIDPDDPPTFESQATYLRRLGLFLPGERKRLKAADWEVRRVWRDADGLHKRSFSPYFYGCILAAPEAPSFAQRESCAPP